MRILVDLDNVLANFQKQVDAVWRKRDPGFDYDFSKQTRFKLLDALGGHHQAMIEEILNSHGFFLGMEPLQGGVEAVKEMIEAGHEVYICTSPGDLLYAAGEKSQWVRRHFGDDFTRKLIITRDKSVINGDILIDDKPYIRDEERASWEHILFDQPYNQDVQEKRRLNWSNWREVLKL